MHFALITLKEMGIDLCSSPHHLLKVELTYYRQTTNVILMDTEPTPVIFIALLRYHCDWSLALQNR